MKSFSSSHWWYSVKKYVFKNFVNFTEKPLYWTLFLKKLQERLYFEENEPDVQNLYCVLPKALLIAIRNLLPGFSYMNLKCYMTQYITPEILAK